MLPKWNRAMRLGTTDVRAAFKDGPGTSDSLDLASDLKALRHSPARCQIVGGQASMNAAQRPSLPGGAALPSDRPRDFERDRKIASGKVVVKPGHRQDLCPRASSKGGLLSHNGRFKVCIIAIRSGSELC